MNPPYEVLIHPIFDRQTNQIIRKPLRKRRVDLRDQLAKLAEELRRLEQLPHHNPPLNKKLANVPIQGRQDMEYLVTRVAGATVGKRAGHRLHYAFFEEERKVFPFFMTVSRKDVRKQKQDLDWQHLIVTIAKDYHVEGSKSFTTLEKYSF